MQPGIVSFQDKLFAGDKSTDMGISRQTSPQRE